MKVFEILSTFVFVSLASATTSHVEDLTATNFNDVILQSGKPALVKFYAPWCGHCKALAPVWEKLASSYSNQASKITIAKFNCDDHKGKCQELGIEGYPTVQYYDGKSNSPKNYELGRDLESFQDFIQKNAGIALKVKKEPPSDVKPLTEENFDSIVNGDKNVLVEFYTPWCGYCKQLAPIYEAVGRTFKDETEVVIAKVDVDAPSGKSLGLRFGITGYPTIKYFPKGSTEAKDYDGGRTEALFVEFLNKNAGTYRTVGGLLNQMAGRILEMDQVVENLVKGDTDSLKNVLEKIKKHAETSKETFASYYVRVLEKIGEDKGYVAKELKRLQGILKKGGLSQKKVDELTSKTNILSQFHIDKEAEVKDEL